MIWRVILRGLRSGLSSGRRTMLMPLNKRAMNFFLGDLKTVAAIPWASLGLGNDERSCSSRLYPSRHTWGGQYFVGRRKGFGDLRPPFILEYWIPSCGKWVSSKMLQVLDLTKIFWTPGWYYLALERSEEL
jgi:hypothetical protein